MADNNHLRTTRSRVTALAVRQEKRSDRVIVDMERLLCSGWIQMEYALKEENISFNG